MAKGSRISIEEVTRRIEEARARDVDRMDLSHLGLTGLPEAIGQLSQLRSLDLFANELTELPEAIGELSQLRFLDLGANALTKLPQAIGQLSQLQGLVLGASSLAKLPEAIGQRIRHASPNEEIIRLLMGSRRGNQLTKLPAAIGQLSQLRFLDLSRNQLSEVPEEIGQLSQLQHLNLTNNQLTKLPAATGQLSQLRSLDLGNNQLTELPAAIGQLSQLRSLDLGNNQLTELPASLQNVVSLKELYLHDNPRLELPPEVLGPTLNEKRRSPGQQLANPRDILDYYFRTRGGRRPLNEAKLILVGYGDVGKTSLVNRLVHGRFDSREKKTEGINITQWRASLGDGEDIRLHIWDFGGQEIMHSTHQFFLTQRSLYLLVLNGRQGHEDADADYWLSLIDSFGEGSPVIVVLNKMKEHPFDLNRRALVQKFGIVREFVETDCEEETGIEELKKTILRETDRLEHLRDAFPASWFGIKDRLAGMEADYISYDQYREICRDRGEADSAAQESLATYLHSLGIALNYKDDPRLRDTHILNPRWVTNGIYTILNAEALAKQKGELLVDALRDMLHLDDYPPERHGFLLELMRKFELCFTFPEEQGRYLIPELLDKTTTGGSGAVPAG